MDVDPARRPSKQARNPKPPCSLKHDISRRCRLMVDPPPVSELRDSRCLRYMRNEEPPSFRVQRLLLSRIWLLEVGPGSGGRGLRSQDWNLCLRAGMA